MKVSSSVQTENQIKRLITLSLKNYVKINNKGVSPWVVGANCNIFKPAPFYVSTKQLFLTVNF